MPVVHFIGNAFGPDVSEESGDVAPLIDLCDRINAPVPFSCRSATCGTCRIEIIQGSEHLEPPSPEEAELLAILADPPSRRLACSARVKPGPGLLRIAIVEDG